jgi:hypothetical protein
MRRAVLAQWRNWRPTLLELRALVRSIAAAVGTRMRRLLQEIRARRAAPPR